MKIQAQNILLIINKLRRNRIKAQVRWRGGLYSDNIYQHMNGAYFY